VLHGDAGKIAQFEALRRDAKFSAAASTVMVANAKANAATLSDRQQADALLNAALTTADAIRGLLDSVGYAQVCYLCCIVCGCSPPNLFFFFFLVINSITRVMMLHNCNCCILQKARYCRRRRRLPSANAPRQRSPIAQRNKRSDRRARAPLVASKNLLK
jgi:hypothetical protein